MRHHLTDWGIYWGVTKLWLASHSTIGHLWRANAQELRAADVEGEIWPHASSWTYKASSLLLFRYSIEVYNVQGNPAILFTKASGCLPHLLRNHTSTLARILDIGLPLAVVERVVPFLSLSVALFPSPSVTVTTIFVVMDRTSTPLSLENLPHELLHEVLDEFPHLETCSPSSLPSQFATDPLPNPTSPSTSQLHSELFLQRYCWLHRRLAQHPRLHVPFVRTTTIGVSHAVDLTSGMR